VALGPTDVRDRDAIHFGFGRRLGKIMLDLVSPRLVLIPVTHDLIHASAVEKAVRATDVIGKMAREDRAGWGELHVARWPIYIIHREIASFRR
jgi:hypothetical protein